MGYIVTNIREKYKMKKSLTHIQLVLDKKAFVSVILQTHTQSILSIVDVRFGVLVSIRYFRKPELLPI